MNENLLPSFTNIYIYIYYNVSPSDTQRRGANDNILDGIFIKILRSIFRLKHSIIIRILKFELLSGSWAKMLYARYWIIKLIYFIRNFQQIFITYFPRPRKTNNKITAWSKSEGPSIQSELGWTDAPGWRRVPLVSSRGLRRIL